MIGSPEEIQTFRVISRRISCSTSVKGQTNQRHLMKTKILRNIFISVGVLFASAQLLSAGMNDGVLNFNNTPLVSPQATFITFDAPGGQSNLAAERHQPGGGHHRNLHYGKLPKHRVSRLPAGARRHIHDPRSAGLHRNLDRLFLWACRPTHQPGRGHHGNLF